DVSYDVRCSFQRTPTDDKRRGRRIVSSAVNKSRLLTFSPAVVRHPFVAVAYTETDTRRSLLPLIFPPGQSATRPSSRRNVDRSARARRQTGGRDANRSIFRGPRCAPFHKKHTDFPLR